MADKTTEDLAKMMAETRAANPSKQPYKRWHEKHEPEQGAYWALCGFEQDIRDYVDDELVEAYDNMDVYDQIRLFALVTDLIDEALDQHQEVTT